MGKEANCTARFKKQVSAGHAMLETDFVLFRGDFRVKIPFKSMRTVKAAGACLKIDAPEGTLELDLGPAAAKWEQKILHPPSRLDKIGVKLDHKVVILSVDDAALVDELTERGANIAKRAAKGTDIVFFGAGKMPDLERLESLKPAIHPDGAVWIIYPKGVKHITQADVMAATKAAGLVDTKVCAFSATHTALKAVIPVKSR